MLAVRAHRTTLDPATPDIEAPDDGINGRSDHESEECRVDENKHKEIINEKEPEGSFSY
jgi:hypothetical protein